MGLGILDLAKVVTELILVVCPLQTLSISFRPCPNGQELHQRALARISDTVWTNAVAEFSFGIIDKIIFNSMPVILSVNFMNHCSRMASGAKDMNLSLISG